MQFHSNERDDGRQSRPHHERHLDHRHGCQHGVALRRAGHLSNGNQWTHDGEHHRQPHGDHYQPVLHPQHHRRHLPGVGGSNCHGECYGRQSHHRRGVGSSLFPSVINPSSAAHLHPHRSTQSCHCANFLPGQPPPPPSPRTH